MPTNQHSQWGLRIATFLCWAAAAASLAFWGLKWSAAGVKLPAAWTASSGVPASTDAQAVARLLGAGSAATPLLAVPGAASRYVLMGIVAGVRGAGVALIAVDGKPARPFEVGAIVDAPLVLKSVASRQATLSTGVDGPAVATLELPPVKRSQAPARSDAMPTPMPAPMPPPVKASPLEGNPFKPSLDR